MKKRLSVLLAMTILATSLPVSSMRAAEMNRNAAVVCTDTTDGSLKDNDEMKSKDATEQIVQGEVVQKETGKTDEPASGETSAAKPEQSASGEMKQPTSGETEQPAPEGTEQPTPGETEQPAPEETTPDETITEEPGSPAPEVTVPEATEEQTPEETEEGTISGYALMGTALWRIPSRAVTKPITVSDAEGMMKALAQVNSPLSEAGTYEIVLESDVDLSEKEAWEGFGTNENPFHGTFDGNGHTVTLKDGSMPLFCYAKEATIKNVVVKSTGTINWAGVVGHMYGGTIQNCGNLSNVTAISEYAGGVVAYARHAETRRLKISDCWNGGTITGRSYTGGVAGYIAQVSASDIMSVTGAVNFGTVKSSEPNSIAGGIVGGINSNVIVEDVYNGGIVSGKAAAAGIVGKIDEPHNEISYAINSGKVISDGDWNPICYYVGTGSNNKLNLTQTLYDETVNSGTYSIGSENKVNGTPAGKSTLDLIKLNKSDDSWAARQAWRFCSESNARYYPICMSTGEKPTLSTEIANTASSAAFVKDGKDGKKYLCLLSAPYKYSYKGKELKQFEEVTIEAGQSPEEPYITYLDGQYTKKICLPEPGSMTVIYGLYNDNYEISISGTLDKVKPDNDGVYTLSYGEKVNMTLGLINENGSPVTVKPNAWSNAIPSIGLEDKAETGANNTSVRMITGQITATPSDKDVYTLVLAVKVSTDGQEADSWCLKKLKVKVKKADATFIWDSKFSDKEFDNKEYSINAVFCEEKDFKGMENQPSVTVVYYNEEDKPLSGAPKDAGSYSVEMKSPETDAYYEYTVPEKAQFGIAPKQLTNDMVTQPSDLIVETKDQTTEQEITVSDKELNLTLTEGTDYTLEYADTQKPGTAIVTLEGKGNYFTEETIVKKYTIKERLTADMFTLPKSCVVIGMDESTELPVTGTDKLTGETLKQGYDYIVSYSGTDRMGQATVTIKPGKNTNYVEGEEPIVLHYDVKKLLTADMFRLENEDAVTLGTGKEHKKVIGEDKDLKPAVTLKEGTDYVLSYSDTDKPGTATVTVLAAEKSNYVTDKKNPIEFRYTVMLGNSETNLDTGTYRLGNPGLWYLKEQPDVHYYAEIEFYVSSPIRYQFYLVEK